MNDYNNGYMAPIPSNMQNNYNPDISQNQIPNGIAFLNQENVSNMSAISWQLASKMAFLSIRIRI